ncbi:MAG: AAA family ATPase [Coriobacteriia bacterium]|nr:AAA family ATPase [Coriobacteriia bacterium]
MSEIIAIVTSDSRERSRLEFLAKQRGPGEVHFYSSGAELFEALNTKESRREGIAIVGNTVGDIAPLNLVDALRNEFTGMRVIAILANRDDGLVNKAMLAGASAAVEEGCREEDLNLAIERVSRSRLYVPETAGLARKRGEELGKRGNVVTFVGAKGGCGRSTIACLLAEQFSSDGVNVALVDFDLQFGDLGFLFNRIQGPTILEMMQGITATVSSVARYGRPIHENLTLFAPDPAPEKAELLNGLVRTCIAAIRREYDLVLVNTGAFWTLFHAEVLDVSDQAVCVCEQSIVSMRATVQLLGLCSKLGIPAKQFIFVANRMQSRGLSQNDIASGIDVEKVIPIANAPQEFSMIFEGGNIAEALELMLKRDDGIQVLYEHLAGKMGISVRNVENMRSAMHKNSRWLWK